MGLQPINIFLPAIGTAVEPITLCRFMFANMNLQNIEAEYFQIEWVTVLSLCALGLFCKGFWATGVIDGKKSVFSGGGGSLLLNDFQSLAFDSLDIPF